MPPPTTNQPASKSDKLIEYLDKTGHSLEDFFSKIYRDIPEPDTEEARLRAAARLPLGSAETDPKLLQVERDWRQEQADKAERAGDREGEKGSERRGSYDRYLNRLFLRKTRTPQTEEREKQKELRKGVDNKKKYYSHKRVDLDPGKGDKKEIRNK